jgi:hypothetical protein
MSADVSGSAGPGVSAEVSPSLDSSRTNDVASTFLDGSPLPTPEQVVARLNEFRVRRGYVNPQQGPMACALPAVSDGYRVLYKALVLDEKHLGPLEKEFVWLTLLCVAREMGTHHLKLFFEHEGSDAQADAAFRIAGWVNACSSYESMAARWQPFFPELPATDSYRSAFKALVQGFDDVPYDWACLAFLSGHTGGKSKWGVQAALELCYEHGISEARMAEAMSIAMWPCGANCFHDAAGAWLELIQQGRVKASPAFQAWASLPSQDGLELPARRARRASAG